MARWIDYHSVNGRSPVGSVITLLKMVLMKLSSDNKSWFLRWANDLRKMWYHCWNEVIFIRKWKNDKERKWFLDLGLKGGNALLQSSIIPSVTPIIRSSPCHEILLCRWLVGCDSYCYRCDGKGEFKEFKSYQHGIVSIIWWNKTELQAHRWMDRMI